MVDFGRWHGRYTLGGNVALGIDEDRLLNEGVISYNDIWLLTILSVGLGTDGIEGHGYIGYTWVQENFGW